MLLICLIVLVLFYEIVVLRHFGAESLGLLPKENLSRRIVIFFSFPLQEREKKKLALRVVLK